MTDATSGRSERFQAAATVDIEAGPARVWRVLTEPALVSRYMHGTELLTDWTVGGPIVWRGEWQGKPYEDKGRVMTFQPPRILSVTHWSPLTADPDTPEHYHHVTYELQELDDARTRLTLTHGNAPSRDAAEAMIEAGWKPVLQSLKQVAENEI
ncbi:MAG: SRPBCC domain-containing protein [Kineosporiaceae bacterium]